MPMSLEMTVGQIQTVKMKMFRLLLVGMKQIPVASSSLLMVTILYLELDNCSRQLMSSEMLSKFSQ